MALNAKNLKVPGAGKKNGKNGDFPTFLKKTLEFTKQRYPYKG